MTDAAVAVCLVLDHLKIGPKELAVRLGVPLAQVNKWKQNAEIVPTEMERKFEKLIGAEGFDLSEIAWAGSVEALKKWRDLFGWIAESTGDDEAMLFGKEENELLATFTISVLDEMGVAAPKTFPPELDEYRELQEEGVGPNECAFSAEDSSWVACVHLVAEIYSSYAILERWWGHYLFPLTDDENHELIGEIQCSLLSLAAAKFDADKVFAQPFASRVRQITRNFYSFAEETKRTYRRWLNELKTQLIKSGTPLQVELLDLLTRNDDDLLYEDDDDKDYDDDQPQHPDIYLNELLNNTRNILALLRKRKE